MNERHVDVAILGAGTAGLTARRAAEAAGATAVMIDPGPFGTTCARVGCMPSKLLIAAADAAHHAHGAGVFGVRVAEVDIDGHAVMARVQRERDRFVGFVKSSIDEHLEGERLIVGRGRFVDGTLHVGTDTPDATRVHFKSAVIATGSSPFVPPPFRGLGRDVLIDSGGLFDLDTLPESVLVVGTGVIGLELGQALSRLGVRTTIVGIRGVVGPLSDPDVKAEAHRLFSAELDFHADYELHSVEAVEGGVCVRFSSDGAEHEATYQKVLLAAGRRPNTRDLGLDIDLATVDPLTGQLGSSNVFLAGDVSNFRPLLHEAADEGRIAGDNAARFPDVLAHTRKTPLGVVFTDPQIGLVGLRHADLDPVLHRIGEVDYGDQGRSRVVNKHAGLVRIYASRKCGTLVGAEMLGPHVEHTAHLLAWAIQQNMTVDQVLAMPFYHPVIEEGIRTALRDLRKNLRFGEGMLPCRELTQAM
ncbi:MAG: dihydrolipoyl dehydrogenase [Proteobacteria bacterium]|nr:dihydrolipoyl dehydrogenase [Pseudomonadota bacterium]